MRKIKVGDLEMDKRHEHPVYVCFSARVSIICAICSHTLDEYLHQEDSVNPLVKLSVRPCPKCIIRMYEDGWMKGYLDREKG